MKEIVGLTQGQKIGDDSDAELGQLTHMAAACVSTASTDSYWKAHKLLRSEKQLASILSQFCHLSLILAV